MLRRSEGTFFLGITGGIACGKSLIYNCFLAFGVAGISADLVCREIMQQGSSALGEIEAVFGKNIVMENGELDRNLLGKIVFSDPDKIKNLNRIIHPKVEKEILAWAEKIRSAASHEKLVVLEVPLLFETGSYSWLDGILVVCSSKENSLCRMRERDGLSFEECRKRYNSQFSLAEKKKWADWIIVNDYTVEAAENSARIVYDEITSNCGA